MRKRGPAGEGRNRKKKTLPLTACLLAAALAITVMRIPGVTAKAAPVDLGRECSLTVIPSAEPDMLRDLLGNGESQNEVELELYRVADAVAVSGYDTYGYQLTEPYSASDVLVKALTREALSSEDMTNEKWQRELAREAARIALDGAGKEKVSARYMDGLGMRVDGLDPGLYLLVVRDANPDTGKAAAGTEEGDSSEILTRVYTERYEYTFAPQLISLPDKNLIDADGNVVGGNTAAPGEWQYEATATLKPGQAERFGSLEITKSLESYHTEEPAQFVFRVSAYRDDDGDGQEELIYSNVVGITFDQPGQQKAELAGQIPVGARVVVTEEYSGASYAVEGGAVREPGALLSADDLLQTEFTNQYDEHHRGGHGIVNKFTYSDSDGWQWDADPPAVQ